MRKSWILLIALSFLQFSISAAESFFTVQIGTFLNPKLSDFENIRPLGYIYAQQANADIYQIFMGGYDSRKNADIIVNTLKSRGYLDAVVVERNLAQGSSQAIIQLGTRGAKENVNWERYLSLDKIFILFENEQVKIVTGPFANAEEAKSQLAGIRRMGFDDAFVKTVNSVRLHEVNNFELGDAKRPLIPIQFEDNTTARINPTNPNSEFTTRGNEVPMAYDATPSRTTTPTTTSPSTPARTISSPAIPEIRSNVKRHSALELQKVLKQERTYTGSLDGYYGKGTMVAYEQAVKKNQKFLKYAVLARYMYEPDGSGSASSSLQNAINNIYTNPTSSVATLQASKQAVAKAYLAYWNFVNNGASPTVNSLMNSAIQQAFRGATTSRPPFDPTATYAYNNLDQLILHLRYIQSAEDDQPAVPCWMFERHPQAVAKAFDNTSGGQDYRVQSCVGFDDWDIIKILQAIAADLNTQPVNERRLAADASTRASLYLLPKPLPAATQQNLTNWDTRLWQNLESWASRDPMNNEIVTALKLAYYQSQVLLEDYYMTQGFKAEEAKGLALAVLQTLVEYQLARFI